jgi:DNA-binding GntR family transcriptional regulator
MMPSIVDNVPFQLHLTENSPMDNNLTLPSLTDVATLPNRVYLILEEAILQGKIKQGDRLIEEELAGKLGISRAPIREALRMMQKEGLIVISPRKGAFVNSISPEDIAEIYEVSSALEGLAVKLFCTRCTEEELASLRQLYADMEEQVKKADMVQYRKLNRKFHEALIQGSRNKRIKEICGVLQKQISWFQNMNLTLQSRMGVSLQEHRQIIAAFLAKDPEAAGQAASEHITQAAQAFLGRENKDG